MGGLVGREGKILGIFLSVEIFGVNKEITKYFHDILHVLPVQLILSYLA